MIITLQTLVFFRESFLNVLDRLLRPYYKKFSLAFGRKSEGSDDEESDEQVFAEFDDERGVVFYPPMYLQRYAAVSDCLMDERWSGKLEKVVDLGYHDMSFIKYLKELPGIKCILGVDIESIPLRCSSDLIGCDDYIPKRENPLEVTLFKGNAADPDYRLIGCDAVIAIEMIEHMLPHDLDRLVHTVFGFVKPHIAIFTTPNGDFNVLFKALERNGLRRLDHFFEWSREQFHDWCSNIVVRYPQYTVTSKGIGPGPSGTTHLGCCSQMALFIAKDYEKQQNLNLNCLALVPDTPNPNSISNLISSWENLDVPNESNMIEAPKSYESSPELSGSDSAKESSITVLLNSSALSLETIPYAEKASQCNLEIETAKNYLMFDYEQMCFDVLTPTKKIVNRVYDIEDVCSRLNCSTLQVNKFSKTTQNLMVKNKVDALVHTREVVDEIRHLTKMLNFGKEGVGQIKNGTHTWCNINWGENAPYWNQYYTIVKQYNYPFETKSEECRILDLISDEINRLIDVQYDEELLNDFNKFEIPIEHLMSVVEHITDDVEKVKDLLEWNGYEVVGNTVIHSRMVVDVSSVGTQDYDSPDTDVYSDWDSTDMRSTSMSDGSTIVPDYHARCLRRALDQKVRKLRSVLTADEDITTELDLVVCRLMKLALRTSKGRSTPPPARWMQCKLLDLLTLTEKSIERRKRYFIENYPLKAINYEEKSQEMVALEKIKEDNTASKIVDKYIHLVNHKDGNEESRAKYRFIDLELEDDLSVSSAEFGKDYEYINRESPSVLEPVPDLLIPKKVAREDKSKIDRTQAWVEEDVEVVPYPDHNLVLEKTSVEINTHVEAVTNYRKKIHKEQKPAEINSMKSKKSHYKLKQHKTRKTEEKTTINVSKTILTKKVFRKKSSNNSLGLRTNNKYVSVDYKAYRVKSRRKQKSLYPTASKPIPLSLIELCHPEMLIENDMGLYGSTGTDINIKKDATDVVSENTEIASIKQSLLIDIITDGAQETIALRRSIGTDVVIDPMSFEEETLIRSVSNTLMNDDQSFEKHSIGTGNVNSQTIFLYDIDEPTTSKGIRHTSMDVQCGPDATAPVYSMLSTTTSFSRMPKMFSAGIKIGDSTTDTNLKSTECGTGTYDIGKIYKTIVPRERSVGIKIKDSDADLISQMDLATLPNYSMPLATTSLSRMPNIIGKSYENTNSYVKTGIDCGTSTNDGETKLKTVSRRKKSDGIKFKDSVTNLAYNYVYPKNNQNIYDKSIISSTQTFSPHEISVGFAANNFDMNLHQRTGCLSESHKFSGASSPTPQNNNTSTLECEPKERSLAFKIKTNESNLTKQIECSTNTQEYYDRSRGSSPPPFCSILKSPSNLKSEDSTSEYCASFGSYTKFPTLLENSKIGDMQIVSAISKFGENHVNMSRKYVKPKLSNGGIQVHSYRDQQISEDIMYQGEWQKNKPKKITRRKSFSPHITRRVIEASIKKKISKEKLQNDPKTKMDLKLEPKRLVPRTFNSVISKQESNKNKIKTNVKSPVTVVAKTKKPFRSVQKVSSKQTLSSAKYPNATNVAIIPTKLTNLGVTKAEATPKNIVKQYIPLYLRQKKLKTADETKKTNLNLSIDSAQNTKNIFNKTHDTTKRQNASKPALIRSKTEEIKYDLLKFQTKAPKPQYAVFCNEIENNNGGNEGQHIISPSDSVKKRDVTRQSISPGSPNSSTCSSPCSISTVRAASVRSKIINNQRYSTSSYQGNTGNSGADNTSHDKNKKFTKRSKSLRTPSVKGFDNKENIPQTTKQNITKKESDKSKSSFVGHKKDVVIAQIVRSSPVQSVVNTLSKHKTQKSNINIPTVESITPKTSSPRRSPSASRKSSVKFDVNPPAINKNEISETAQTSNMVLIIEPQARKLHSLSDIPMVVDRDVLKKWYDEDSCKSAEDSQTCNITSDMRELVNKALDFIDDPSNDCGIDTDTVILSRDNVNEQMELSSSPISFKTVVVNDDLESDILKSDIEYALNRSFDTTLGDESIVSLDDTRLTVTDLDALSFRSMATSKGSEYLSADNELSSSHRVISTHSNSVRDIYERRDQPFQVSQGQHPPGALAVQLFSGFSINGDPVPGDQTDHVNLIDSETGSVAQCVARLATSEELFVSGRSSDSFQSCLLDDDAVVPNWLFQIISQQQSGVESIDPPPELVIPIPIAEPLFDDNGNVVEGPALGSGAGDGRGIHSDHSQDSSGRGTSVSSSETSSGQQSEAVLIDPSAFAAQFELLRDAVDSSVVVLAVNDPGSADNVTSRQDPAESDSSLSRGETRHAPRARPPASTSGHDADVSSIDTDAPDSSTD